MAEVVYVIDMDLHMTIILSVPVIENPLRAQATVTNKIKITVTHVLILRYAVASLPQQQ